MLCLARRLVVCLALLCVVGLVVACDVDLFEGEAESPTATTAPLPAATATKVVSPPEPDVTGLDKWALWVDGPHLRGANIYQRRVYSELDGPEFMGPGPIGPPYTQEDLKILLGILMSTGPFASHAQDDKFGKCEIMWGRPSSLTKP